MMCKNKAVIVTGAASGIGKAAAIAFAREGASVTVADLDKDKGEEVAASIVEGGGKAIFTETDVTSEAAVRAMVEATVSAFGGLDIAFNNAGMPGQYGTAVTCTDEEWSKVVSVNMTSIWYCMKHQIPEMQKRGGGAIVNTASTLGVRSLPFMFAYTATKHAVIGMTRSAAMDFAEQNIRVNALLPGFTMTPMLEAAVQGADVSVEEAMATAIPMKRMSQPEEQAEAAVWMCSEHASYVTGVAMEVDGGGLAKH